MSDKSRALNPKYGLAEEQLFACAVARDFGAHLC